MKFGWKGALGIVVSVAALAYTLNGIDMGNVWGVLQRSNWMLFVVSGVAATLVFPLRALRWQVILEPIAHVPFGALWRSVAIGMMVNNLVPARAGELARAFALTRETRDVNFATAFASLAVDRIIDAVVVVTMMVVAVAVSDIPPGTMISGWTVTRTICPMLGSRAAPTITWASSASVARVITSAA